jgi:transcriptional regulator with XRE-family HTH domain
MNIGKAIKELRKEKGISQTEFAELCGLTQTSLSQIETGTKRPNPKNLSKICKNLQIPEMYLYLLGAEETDVPTRNKELYKHLFPTIKTMLKDLLIGKV